MKRLVILFLVAATTGCLLFLPSTSVHAANASDFNPGHIIDDVVFYNSNALSVDQIQQFLNSKVPNCDTNGTQSAADWGYPGITHAQLAEYKRNGTNGFKKDTGFHAPPYTCLRNYSQATPQMEAASGYCSAIGAGTRTAAQIIRDIGSACGINPEVLIVLLDKEQSLITDNWPLQRQYNNATGFACPDTAPCDPSYAGFFYQVYYAARQFKVYQAHPNNYNYIAGRYNNIYWSPTLSCGSSSVYIENQATAALYIYTPYRPNQAALNNLYGSGDSCSAYGNRNFWRTFTDWFGSTIRPWDTAITARYNVLSNDTKTALGSQIGVSACGLKNGGCYQQYQNGYIVGTTATGYWESMGGTRWRWNQLGNENGIMGYPTGPLSNLPGGTYQQFQNGFIVGTDTTGYWESMGGIRDRWFQLSYENGKMGYPTGAIVCGIKKYGCYQQYQNGYIVGTTATGYWESMGNIRTRWSQLNFQDGPLGYPLSTELCGLGNGGCYQLYEGGYIIGTPESGYWESYGGIRGRWATLGFENSSLGYPISAVTCGMKNNGCFQQYQNGFIVGSPTTGYWESMGGVRTRWFQLSYQNGTIGYPTGALDCTQQPNSGCMQRYQGGTIYWSPTTGGWQVWGLVGNQYNQLGEASSSLGYPITTEVCGTIKGGGCYQQFQNGFIVGTTATGYWESMGGIRDRWFQLSYENGKMGYPLSTLLCGLRGGGCYQLYQGGYIVGTAATGYWESYGAIRNKWGSLGFETSTAGYPTGPVTCTGNSCSQTYEHGTIISDGSGTRYTP